MGCCATAPADERFAQKEKQRSEHEKLMEEFKKATNIKKLLFLGPGGSGKSTIFKQLREIHGSAFLKKDIAQFIDHIYAQIIEQMKLSLECIERIKEEEFDIDAEEIEANQVMGEGGGEGGEGGNSNAAVNIKKEIDEVKISYNDLQLTDAGKSAADYIQSIDRNRMDVTPEVAENIKILWRERAIKYIFSLRSTMKIDDSCSIFWDEIDRIAAHDYLPNDYDILLVRYRTTGVIEQKFVYKGNYFHVFDVGGQKSERKKWIHCFEAVTAVLFCAALSCYDEVMFEDEEINSMDDAIKLFEQIVNNEFFKNTAMILLLTKKDLFAQKIQRVPITQCPSLKQYAGIGDSYDDGVAYIKEIFEKCNNDKNKQIFTHCVDCTDKESVKNVFDDIQSVIINASLERAGLV